MVEKLSVRVIVGTQFHERHLEAIWCQQGRIQLTYDEDPIMASGKKDDPWYTWKKMKVYQEVKSGTNELRKVEENDESSTLTKLRTIRAVTVPAFT